MNIGLIIFLFVNLLIITILAILVIILWRRTSAQKSQIELFVGETVKCSNLSYRLVQELGEKISALAIESSGAMTSLNKVNKAFVDYFKVLEDRIRALEGRPTMQDDQPHNISEEDEGPYLGDVM